MATRVGYPPSNDTSTPITPAQPPGYAPMKRGQVISPGMVIAIIAAVGITVGLSFLAAHTGAGWVHDVAMTGAVFSGISSVSSIALGIIFGVKKYKANKRYEALNPREIPARPQLGNPAQQPIVSAVRDTQDQWAQRLQIASKCQANGGAYNDFNALGPCYYDLTHNVEEMGAKKLFAESLDLGNNVHFLKIPHFGQYGGAEYRPDDHDMAVRLPLSQLETFPDEIQQQLANEQNPELYFMVFKNYEEAQNWQRINSGNISMHTMALSNYNRNDPDGNRLQEQRSITTRDGGRAFQTTMKIAMYSTVGIEPSQVNEHEAEHALTSRLQTVPISIHTSNPENVNQQHIFSNNHARFGIAQNIDVSSMHIVAKIPGRAVAIHALILNNQEGEHGGNELSAAVQQNSLEAFLKNIDQAQTLDPDIKAKIKRTFTHPSRLIEVSSMEAID